MTEQGGAGLALARERLAGAIGAGSVVGLLLAGLLWGLAAERLGNAARQPGLLIVPARPLPVEKSRPRPSIKPSPAAKRKAGPPNLRNRATPVASPPPIVPLPAPSPIIVAAQPALGTAPQTGASDRAGSGTGAGGIGDGDGGGGSGDGNGYYPPRQIRGALRNSDLPIEVLRDQDAEGLIGSVGVRYHVETDGKVGSCAVTRSSGKPALDGVTCALIQARFRFKPSRDAAGRPVGSFVEETHSWGVLHEDRPADRN